MLSNLDDIRNIDESISDIYNIRECRSEESNEKNVKNRIQTTNLDEIIALNRGDNYLKISEPEEKYQMKKINESNDTNLLNIPSEQKPLHKLYGSSRHLFCRQKSMEITEETPFLLASTVKESKSVDRIDKEKELKIPKHDSQESVQRVITERRKLDENFKDINQYDIFDVSTHSSEENLVDKDNSKNENSIERVNDLC